MELDSDALTPLVDGIWLASEPVSIIGMKLTSTMTVVRLEGDALLLYSPITASPRLRSAVDALGPVEHLYAPNTFHHMRLGDWAAAHPAATLHGPAGLVTKRSDLTIDRVHGPAQANPFSECVEEIPIEGFRLEETALFHRPSRTLMLADLVHNVGRPRDAWSRFYTKLMGFHDRVALSRMIRWTAFPDRSAARRSVGRILDLPFERVVVGHGAPITEDPKTKLAEGLAWLPRR